MHFKLKSKYEEFPPLIGKSVWYSATAAGAEVEHQMTSEIDKLLPFSIYSIHPVRTDTAIFFRLAFWFFGLHPVVEACAIYALTHNPIMRGCQIAQSINVYTESPAFENIHIKYIWRFGLCELALRYFVGPLSNQSDFKSRFWRYSFWAEQQVGWLVGWSQQGVIYGRACLEKLGPLSPPSQTSGGWWGKMGFPNV